MARYIDADKLGIGKAKREAFTVPEYADGWNSAIDIIFKAPTADVAEVVRCKDCKHYFHYGRTALLVDGKNIKAGWCQRRIRYDEEHRMLPDDFCSYGERKEQE